MKKLLPALLALSLPITTSARPEPAPPAADPATPPPELANIPVALLVDVNSGRVLYAKEPDRRFMPASITKVMTLWVAFEMLENGQLKPDQRFSMSEDAFKHWHNVGSSMHIDREHDASVDELLMAIANVSANDGCIVLAEGAAGSVPGWVALMNAEAAKLGMRDSHFGMPNGWMDEGETWYTAHDLATLATAMVTRHPDLYHRYIGHETLTWNGITQHNHDPMLGKVPGTDGIKTGFTNQAGYGYVGSAERDGRRLVMVVAGVDLPKDRARASAALIEWGFAAFADRPLFAQGDTVGEAQVQGGAARSVPLVAPAGYAVTNAMGKSDPVSLKITYDGPLPAPIAKGSTIAALEITQAGQPPRRLPLVAGEDVAEAGPLQRLWNGLAGLIS